MHNKRRNNRAYEKSPVKQKIMVTKKYTDIKVGDIVTVFDEYAHDYLVHRIKIENIEYDEENITEDNPQGMVCYGTDMEEEEWGDDYLTVATVLNFIGVD